MAHRVLVTPAVTELARTEVGTDGPRLVFLHGLFGQGKNWTTVAKALSDGYRSTLVDLPDHGRSPWSDRFSYDAMADAVAGLLSVDDPAHLVGHSMGGKVAMNVALRRPELVARLTVVDIAPVRYERLSSFAGYVAGMRSLDLDALPDRTAADVGLQPSVADPVVRSFLLQNLRRTGDGGHPWRWQLNLQLLGDHLDAIGDWPVPQAEPYRGPVLWLAGGQSDYVQPSHAATMRGWFPRARLITVNGAGHWVHAERPEVFVQALRAFAASAATSRV